MLFRQHCFCLTDSSFHSAWCLVVNKKTPGPFLFVWVWFTLEIGTFKSQTGHPPSLVTVQITMQNCYVHYRVFMFALQSTLGRTIEASRMHFESKSLYFASFTSDNWSYDSNHYFASTHDSRNNESSCVFVWGRGQKVRRRFAYS